MSALSHLLNHHWRLLVSLLIGALMGGVVHLTWHVSLSAALIIGWDITVLSFIASIIVMMRHDTLHKHLSSTRQSTFFILSLITVSSFICVYAIARQTQLAETYKDITLVLSLILTIATIFIAWLMIQVVFALQYAYLYFSEQQKGQRLPLAFPEMSLDIDKSTPGTSEPPKYVDFFYCAVAIGTSGQTADVTFTSLRGRKLAILHSIIAFAFNLSIIALLINIIAAYL